MLDPQTFTGHLRERGYTFFTGVPDSLLKELCACFSECVDPSRHIITANEGGAIGLAAGYHLATGDAPVVYMQNSGFGNAINPLLSLADSEVYSIPMLVIVGWRGEPGVKDEPQHLKQGRVQVPLLEAVGYRYEILPRDEAEAVDRLDALTLYMKRNHTPVVLLVRKDSFAPYAASRIYTGENEHPYEMTREEALRIILGATTTEDRVVSTTGKASREIYELREASGQGHERDFLTVGSMGHAVMIALGLARFQRHRVLCIDGDGAAVMHLGNLAIASRCAPESFFHVLINNGAHESVGGQPTIGFQLDFPALARQLGYETAARADTADELATALNHLMERKGPRFLEVRVRKGSRKNLGRPATRPIRNKTALMEAL